MQSIQPPREGQKSFFAAADTRRNRFAYRFLHLLVVYRTAEIEQVRRKADDRHKRERGAAEQFAADDGGREQCVRSRAEHGDVAEADGRLYGDPQQTACRRAEACPRREQRGYFAADKTDG